MMIIIGDFIKPDGYSSLEEKWENLIKYFLLEVEENKSFGGVKTMSQQKTSYLKG